MCNRGFKLVVTLCATLLVVACATVPESRDERDPWESYNRAMFGFNEGVDRALVKPLAKGYVAVVPQFARTGIGNFLSNLDDVVIAVNNLLQGKVRKAASDVGRVLINSTLGIVGLFDVASRMGLAKHDEDFGQTLAVWGVGSGPYFVLPLLGPSTVRDAPGVFVDMSMHPMYNYEDKGVRTSLTTLNAVDARAGLLPNDKLLDEAGGDRYAVVRNAWLARRDHLIHDGRMPVRDDGDDLLRELEEMESESVGEPPIELEIREPVLPRREREGLIETGIKWVYNQNPTHYTVQLAGFSSADGLAQYARQYGLEDESHFVMTYLEGRPWYLLILGSYPTLDEARKAAKALPQEVQAAGLWIRNFGGIRDAAPFL